MDMLNSSLSEGILYIPDEPAPKRRVWSRWRVAGWVGCVAIAGLVIVPLAMAIGHAVRESRRQQCTALLKQIGVAFHEYHNTHSHFPASWLAGRDGKPLLSWRVALLPYLGYRSLYERFHLFEPWDSLHNRELLSMMPREFSCPAGPRRDAGLTGYLAIVGPISEFGNTNTAFQPNRGVEIREFIDGTSNTVLVLETDTLVPWTKPDDLRWERDGPLPRLASPHAGGANVLFADGSAKFLKSTIDRLIFLGLLTMNGNEVLSSD
jgi:prepilin-type processing-associated H-X9-DG protein